MTRKLCFGEEIKNSVMSDSSVDCRVSAASLSLRMTNRRHGQQLNYGGRNDIKRAKINCGPVFRKVRQNGVVESKRFSDRSVALILKRCVGHAGFAPEEFLSRFPIQKMKILVDTLTTWPVWVFTASNLP
jgi:hypothetical protein